MTGGWKHDLATRWRIPNVIAMGFTLIHDCDEKMTFRVCLETFGSLSILVPFRLIPYIWIWSFYGPNDWFTRVYRA